MSSMGGGLGMQCDSVYTSKCLAVRPALSHERPTERDETQAAELHEPVAIREKLAARLRHHSLNLWHV